jgi:hypothetical protein
MQSTRAKLLLHGKRGIAVEILLAVSVKHTVEEIFRKIPGIEAEADATIKETESSCLWFEIYGIYRFISSLEWQINLIHSEAHQLEARRELNEAKNLLTHALMSAENIYEKVMVNKRRATAIQDGW